MASESTARKPIPMGLKPWPPGVSPNPGGRSRLQREYERAVREANGPEKVVEVVERMRRIAMGLEKVDVPTRSGDVVTVDFHPGAQVAAASLYLNRVMGRESLPTEEPDRAGNAEEALMRVLEKAKDRPELWEKVKLRLLDGGKANGGED